jgi:prevent-host-death family protein
MADRIRGMEVTASKLRQNVYRILDRVLETGEPVEIVRRGRRLKIIAAEHVAKGKLERLRERPKVLLTDPEDLVHLDWSAEWKP